MKSNDTPAWLKEEEDHDNEVSVVFKEEVKVTEPVAAAAAPVAEQKEVDS